LAALFRLFLFIDTQQHMTPANSRSFSHSVQWRAIPMLFSGTVLISGVIDHYITVVFCNVVGADYSISVTVSTLLASGNFYTIVCSGVMA
jgi:hypothetical protein